MKIPKGEQNLFNTDWPPAEVDAREIFWRGEGTGLKIESRYGMKLDWTAATLMQFPAQPFSVTDIAKILEAEKYDSDKRSMFKKTKLLVSKRRGPTSIASRLQAQNFKLQILQVDEHDIRLIGLPADAEEFTLEDFYNSRQLTDEELLAWAIQLRRYELNKDPMVASKIENFPSSVPTRAATLLGESEGQPFTKARLVELLISEGEDPRKLAHNIEESFNSGSIQRRLANWELDLHKIMIYQKGARRKIVALYMALGFGKVPDWGIDNKPFWEGVNIEQPQKRVGMYTDWIIEVFKEFEGRPLTYDDFAKILYAEEYDATQLDLLNIRAGRLIHGTKSLKQRLAAGGLKFAVIHLDEPGKRGLTRLMAVPLDRNVSAADIDESQRPSNDELKKLAIRVRREEITFQQERAVKEDKLTDLELSVLDLVSQGRTDAEIEEELSLSSWEVKRAKRDLVKKLVDEGPETTVRALNNAIQGDILSVGTPFFPLVQLITEEKEAIDLMVVGYEDEEIANHLGISLNNVIVRLREVKAKLRAENRNHIVRLLTERVVETITSNEQKQLRKQIRSAWTQRNNELKQERAKRFKTAFNQISNVIEQETWLEISQWQRYEAQADQQEQDLWLEAVERRRQEVLEQEQELEQLLKEWGEEEELRIIREKWNEEQQAKIKQESDFEWQGREEDEKSRKKEVEHAWRQLVQIRNKEVKDAYRIWEAQEQKANRQEQVAWGKHVQARIREQRSEIIKQQKEQASLEAKTERQRQTEGKRVSEQRAKAVVRRRAEIEKLREKARQEAVNTREREKIAREEAARAAEAADKARQATQELRIPDDQLPELNKEFLTSLKLRHPNEVQDNADIKNAVALLVDRGALTNYGERIVAALRYGVPVEIFKKTPISVPRHGRHVKLADIADFLPPYQGLNVESASLVSGFTPLALLRIESEVLKRFGDKDYPALKALLPVVNTELSRIEEEIARKALLEKSDIES